MQKWSLETGSAVEENWEYMPVISSVAAEYFFWNTILLEKVSKTGEKVKFQEAEEMVAPVEL